jgi:glycosyltransferase involved in cell wall biosynthesis
VLEAAAQGVPAIVPDTSAARDYVVDGETGFWFRGGDVDDLASKMAKLSDPDIARNMGQAAYDRFWSNPSTLDDHAMRLEEVYRKVIASKNQSRTD